MPTRKDRDRCCESPNPRAVPNLSLRSCVVGYGESRSKVKISRLDMIWTGSRKRYGFLAHSPQGNTYPVYSSVTRAVAWTCLHKTLQTDDGTPLLSYQIENENPLTPVETPTSASYDKSFFRTPQLELSVHDSEGSWLSPDPQAGSLQQVQTPIPDSRRRYTTEKLLSRQDIDNQLASHVHHFSPNPLVALPPVDSSRLLSSSRRDFSGIKDSNTNDSILTNRKREGSEVPESIRTPPPSRTSERQGERSQTRKLSTSTMADPRRNSNSRLSNMVHQRLPVASRKHLRNSFQLCSSHQICSSLCSPVLRQHQCTLNNVCFGTPIPQPPMGMLLQQTIKTPLEFPSITSWTHLCRHQL